VKVGEHAVVGKETLKFGSIFGSMKIKVNDLSLQQQKNLFSSFVLIDASQMPIMGDFI
jgi:hypothetical protein